MDKEKVLKILEERQVYSGEKYIENEQKKLIRQAEWYQGYSEALLFAIETLKKS
ncbi:hypothetical protein [Lysinibacillus sp. OL1]|uniref:hypothetical protein n=1 Tax=Lysinibacillus sp. OL1 TaxID=2517243 RepID=UPI00187D1F7A|nr:hypothetical protein [Lysinibacillus sp. OL1]